MTLSCKAIRSVISSSFIRSTVKEYFWNFVLLFIVLNYISIMIAYFFSWNLCLVYKFFFLFFLLDQLHLILFWFHEDFLIVVSIQKILISWQSKRNENNKMSKNGPCSIVTMVIFLYPEFTLRKDLRSINWNHLVLKYHS